MMLEAVFLGINDAGEEVYDWLNEREDVIVKALLREKEQLSLIEDIEPDIVISSGFEYRVPSEIIDIPERGIINLHPSFLPYNRGAHPQIWCLAENTPAGVSIHYMNEEIDEGPIIDRREVEVLPEDTAKDLYNRLKEEQVEQFKEVWPDIVEDDIEIRSQNLQEDTTHLKKDLDELCRIDRDEEVRAGDFLDRLRALSWKPYKNAYFERYGKKYYVEIEITPEDS